MNPLTFSFDIGYASIGWCAIEAEHPQKPRVIGTGVVIFQSDDCLASERREHRRLRRTIRARRQRIERIGCVLKYSGLLKDDELGTPGHPLPFLLAARAFRGEISLTPLELWHVLRWYAHNRGYDGNERWANEDESRKCAASIKKAEETMKELKVKTMAETVCKYLKLDLNHNTANIRVDSSKYKGIVFPRETVEYEVCKICEQTNWLPQCVRDLILDEASNHQEALKKAGIVLPRRYSGSLLFGQLMPRFDNRIIRRCPITWTRVFNQYMEKVQTLPPEQCREQARKEADKMAKVPKADCREFYEYRFARVLANVRVEDKPLSAEVRNALWKETQERGMWTVSEFREKVEKLTEKKPNNLQNYFLLVPESEKALIFRPKKEEQKASGRAPYARPVLRQVVEEVRRGEDPTRPACSDTHPDGEDKMEDGVLYCLLDSGSAVNELLLQRSIDNQTNNPLVRHRLLIFERLLRDMVKKYANGDASRVKRCVVEVAREVRTFAGKNSKKIQAAWNEKRKGFMEAVKFLKENARQLKGLEINASLIRKCRIAMDMNWTCPYTGCQYDVTNLPNMEIEHIIPYSARETNELAALTLTWGEVNRMKGNRTGLEFISECAGKYVVGSDNRTVRSVKSYKEFVKALKPTKIRKEMSDDDKCRSRRKKMFLAEIKTNEKDKGFTTGQLTQSSQLMRMGAQVVKKQLKTTRVEMIPGRITAEMRKYWKLMGTLAAVVPGIEGKEKQDIRDITDLHHAIDACALGLIPHLVPCGTNGAVWEALTKRRVTPEQKQKLRLVSDLFTFSSKDGMFVMQVKDVPREIKDSIISALKEKRVVQHIPSDMGGAKLEEQYRGVEVKKNQVSLTSKKDPVKTSKVLGLKEGKLQRIGAALMITGNYGIAVAGKEGRLIRHVSVCKTLKDVINELRSKYPGQKIRIFRRGMLVQIDKHEREERNGIWRIAALKDDMKKGLIVDLVRPELRKEKWVNVRLSTLIKAEVCIIPVTYVGK